MSHLVGEQFPEVAVSKISLWLLWSLADCRSHPWIAWKTLTCLYSSRNTENRKSATQTTNRGHLTKYQVAGLAATCRQPKQSPPAATSRGVHPDWLATGGCQAIGWCDWSLTLTKKTTVKITVFDFSLEFIVYKLNRAIARNIAQGSKYTLIQSTVHFVTVNLDQMLILLWFLRDSFEEETINWE